MVGMEEKREKLVVGLTSRQMIRTGSSSSSSPAATASATAADSNKDEKSEGVGHHKPAIKQKKGKTKALKWRSSNTDMNGRGEAACSGGDLDDTVLLSSLTTASFISRKRVRTLGKVAEDCDAVDPPVPRKLRSAINKRAGRTVSTSPRHFKKRRHLSAISAQLFFMDCETRCKKNTLVTSFTKDEEVVLDALLSLSEVPPLRELTADSSMAEDCSDKNVASASCPEAMKINQIGAIKEEEKIAALSTVDNEVANQPSRTDEPLEQTCNVPQVNPVPEASRNNINTPMSKDWQKQDVSLRIITNLLSPSKDYSNSSRKQLKVKSDDSKIYPAKPEVPQWLANSNKPDHQEYCGKKVKNNNTQETEPLVQTSLPCTSHGHLMKPSTSTLVAPTRTATETSKATAGNHESQLSLVTKGASSKTWKRSITHVYMSHLIQMHLNKEKASQNRVKPEEIPCSQIYKYPNDFTLNKNNVQDKRYSATHFDVRLPVHPSSVVCDPVTARQKMVSGGFLNVPTSAALPGAHHIQYLHPQITTHGAMPYTFAHHPYNRGNLAPAASYQQQMAQYICNPVYGSPTTMKIQHQQLQQQHQQMWINYPHYQPMQDAAATAAWQQSSRLHDMASLHPASSMLPPPPQMELLCAPYHGGSRQPPQLRLI